MILQMPGGVCFASKTDAWKHHYTLSDAGRVYLRLPPEGQFRLAVEKDEPVRIGSLIAVADDASPVYATVSGTFDGVFSLRGHLYAGITDNTQRMAIPVREPESRPIDEIPKEELIDAVRELFVFDTRRGGYLWKTLSGRIGKTRRILVDLTDAVSWSFTNYAFALDNADAVLNGAKVLCSLLGATKIVLITDASRKKVASRLEELIRDSQLVSVAPVAVRYPVCESTLLSAIYNLPAGTDYPDMFFVSGQSAAALYCGLTTGFAHTEQGLSVSGEGFGNPCVLRVPVGTTWKTVLRFCKFKGGSYRTRVGSPLTGPAASGILRIDQDCLFSFPERTASPSECISCGRCASVCPVRLYPFRILSARNYRQVRSMASACIRCGCCAYACPSAIPLNDLIRQYAAGKEDGADV